MVKKKVKPGSNKKISIIVVVAVLAIAVLSLLVFFSDGFAGEAIRIAVEDARLLNDAGIVNDVETMNAAGIEVSAACSAVKFDNDIHAGMNGDTICQNIGKSCRWILSKREVIYYDTADLAGTPIDCNDKAQAVFKEYSLTEIVCSGLQKTLASGDSCSRFTSVGSSEPKLGDVKTTAYQPYEIMCC